MTFVNISLLLILHWHIVIITNIPSI